MTFAWWQHATSTGQHDDADEFPVPGDSGSSTTGGADMPLAAPLACGQSARSVAKVTQGLRRRRPDNLLDYIEEFNRSP